MKKTVRALACMALLGASGWASAIDVAGINIPGDYGSAVFAVASVYENVVTGVGQTLRGYGEVTSINGTAVASLCGASCELTYRFDNYIVTSLSPTAITFSGGIVNMYLQTSGADFNPWASASSAVDLAAATNGTLWLAMTGHQIDAAGNTFAGTGNNIGGVAAAGNGAGLLDVSGGAAAGWFDTNTIASSFGGPADIQIGSSFSNVLLPHPSECPGGPACLSGSADLRGVLAPIPEPETYALMLAGLGVVGWMARRRGGKA